MLAYVVIIEYSFKNLDSKSSYESLIWQNWKSSHKSILYFYSIKYWKKLFVLEVYPLMMFNYLTKSHVAHCAFSFTFDGLFLLMKLEYFKNETLRMII
jgi:hypothetical protein